MAPAVFSRRRPAAAPAAAAGDSKPALEEAATVGAPVNCGADLPARASSTTLSLGPFTQPVDARPSWMISFRYRPGRLVQQADEDNETRRQCGY